MKVFVVIDYWFPGIGGGPIQVAELAKRISKKKDVEITVVTSNLITGKNNLYDVKDKNLRVIRLGKKYSYTSFIGKLNFLFNLSVFLLRSDFDIFHVHPYSPLLVAKLISFIKKKPLIVTIHALGKDVSGSEPKSLYSRILQYLDRFLTFTVPYTAQIFVDKTLIKKKNATTQKYFVPNGVDIKLFNSVKRKKEKGFQYLFVGRFHPQKNLTSFIDAFSRVINHYPQAKLLLVGEGEEEEKLKKQINNLRLSQKIQILQPLFGKKLIEIYKSSHLFVLPSRYEGFPITILEAWAAALPVAATSVGMIPKILKDSENGFLIKSPEVEDIGAVLLKAVKSKNLLRKLGRNGYQFVAAKYDWNNVSEETYNIYKKIVSK